MNGLEAAPIFKKMFPDTPIIMFTMFAYDAFAKAAIAAGVTEVISKDNATHLMPRVRSLLDLLGEQGLPSKIHANIYASGTKCDAAIPFDTLGR